MGKKSILTSVATSMVLASVLVLSGCGGDNNSDTSIVPAGSTYVASVDNIVADASGKVTNGGVSASAQNVTVKFKQVKNANNTPACQNASPCKATCENQQAVKGCGGSNDAGGLKAELRLTDADVEAILKYADDHAAALGYDSTKHMIVYGGTIIVSGEGFSKCNMSFDIPTLKCGIEIRTKVTAGFGNPGHKVMAWVKPKDGSAAFWTDQFTIGADGKVTITMPDGTLVSLANGGADIVLVSIKDANKPNSAGASS